MKKKADIFLLGFKTKNILKSKHNLLFLLGIAVLSLISILPLLHPGFFKTDDADWMIIRFSAFHQALAQGQFPVRFLPRLNFEYGYPVANFLYPGFMYLAEPLRLFKLGFVESIKIISAISLITSAVFTYAWLSKLFNRWAAASAAVVYLYSPYHLYDIYTRGSVGEILSLAIVPFILWMIEERRFLLTAFGIGLLLLAHNTLAVFFLPIIVLYAYLSRRDLKFCLSTLSGGLGLAAFFWLPALYDLQFTIFFHTKVADWQQYFAKVNDIGLINTLILLCVSVILLFTRQLTPILSKKDQQHFSLKQKQLTILFFIFTCLTIFLSLQLSTPIWKLLPVSFIQFPFRLLSGEILGITFLTAFFVYILKKQFERPLSIVIITLSILLALPLLTAVHYEEKGEGFYATNEDTTTVKNEYMPKWVKELPQKRPDQKITAKNAQITNMRDTGREIDFEIQTTQDTLISINTIYYPGWEAKIGGRQTKISYNNPKGIMQLPVNAGKQEVQLYFTETPIRQISNILSVLSIVILLGITTFTIVKKKNKKK